MEYQTADIETARLALLDFEKEVFRQVEQSELREQFAPDVDQLLAANYSRLFLIYEHQGATNKASAAYRNAARHVRIYSTRRGKRNGLEPDQLVFSDAEIEDTIRGVSRQFGDPAWKNE